MFRRLLLSLTAAALCAGVAACHGSVSEAGENTDGSRSDSLTGLATGAASDTPPPPPAAPAQPTGIASDDPDFDGTVADGTGRSVQVENDLYQFAYSYPDQAGAIPGLKSMFDADIARQQGRTRRLAQADKDASDKSAGTDNPIPFHPGQRNLSWKVVASIPGWLSLSGKGYAYTGGAHGNTWYGEVLWDKNANLERKPLSLFTSSADFLNAIRAPFCAALNQARAQKRGGQGAGAGTIAEFNACIDPTRETVVFASSNGQTFDHIEILIPPYEAGPYSEGTYEVTLPVTQAVMGALLPQFQSSFSVSG